MTQMFHGGAKVVLHSGLCLTESFDAAVSYSEGRGDAVFAVDIDLSGLVVERAEVTRQMIDDNRYPGDTAKSRAAYLADGVDVLIYDDMDMGGRSHRTIRLLSEAAIAAVADTYEMEV